LIHCYFKNNSYFCCEKIVNCIITLVHIQHGRIWNDNFVQIRQTSKNLLQKWCKNALLKICICRLYCAVRGLALLLDNGSTSHRTMKNYFVAESNEQYEQYEQYAAQSGVLVFKLSDRLKIHATSLECGGGRNGKINKLYSNSANFSKTI